MKTSSPWRETPFAVVDVEGNGASPPQVVEVAIAQIDVGARQSPAVSWLIRPRQPITPIVSRIHGIYNWDVEDAPTFAEVAPQLKACLASRVLVAHSANVEVSVLSREFEGAWQPEVVLDTLKLAKSILPGLKSYRLEAVAGELHIGSADIPGERHRAGFDTELTVRVFLELASRSGAKSVDDLLGRQSKPPRAAKRSQVSRDSDALF